MPRKRKLDIYGMARIAEERPMKHPKAEQHSFQDNYREVTECLIPLSPFLFSAESLQNCPWDMFGLAHYIVCRFCTTLFTIDTTLSIG